MKINEATNVQMPLKTVISLIAVVAIGTMSYFSIVERLNKLETANKLMEQDLLEASTQKPIDQEQFMLLEHIALQVEKVQERIENMMHNKVNIERNQKDIEKALVGLEKLKDKVRANGTH